MSRTATTSTSQPTNQPTIYLVAYDVGLDDWHLAIRSEGMVSGTHQIIKIDTNTDIDWLSLLAIDQQPQDKNKNNLLPADIFAGYVFGFSAPMLPDKTAPDIEKTPKYHPKIPQARQYEYLQTIARLLKPNLKTDPENISGFFKAKPENDLLTNPELEILGDVVFNGDQFTLEFILSQLTATQLKQALTTPISATGYAGQKFTGTIIQAALACGDFAPNQNSTGLCELLVEEIKKQYPDDWWQIVHDQTLELYTKSLQNYARKQIEKIHDLYRRAGEGEAIDTNVISAAEDRLDAYERALHSNDLITIIHAHTNPDPDPSKSELQDAQKDHVIQVDEALIDAITDAKDEEIQAVLGDRAIDSPLSNLIKQFRADVDSLCQSEIIANPQHVLKLFMLYEAFYNCVKNDDPDWKKRELFWCHLVGYVQRYLPACDAQIFANPGLYFTIENGAKKNERSFDFKCGGGRIFPLAFDSNAGLGYQFAVASRTACGTAVDLPWRHPAGGSQNLCQAKTKKLGELIQRPALRARSKTRCAVM